MYDSMTWRDQKTCLWSVLSKMKFTKLKSFMPHFLKILIFRPMSSIQKRCPSELHGRVTMKQFSTYKINLQHPNVRPKLELKHHQTQWSSEVEMLQYSRDVPVNHTPEWFLTEEAQLWSNFEYRRKCPTSNPLSAWATMKV